jgi:hypothetical protein
MSTWAIKFSAYGVHRWVTRVRDRVTRLPVSYGLRALARECFSQVLNWLRLEKFRVRFGVGGSCRTVPNTFGLWLTDARQTAFARAGTQSDRKMGKIDGRQSVGQVAGPNCEARLWSFVRKVECSLNAMAVPSARQSKTVSRRPLICLSKRCRFLDDAPSPLPYCPPVMKGFS